MLPSQWYNTPVDLWGQYISLKDAETVRFYMESIDPDLFLGPKNTDFGQKLQKLDFRDSFYDGNSIFLQ